MPWLSKTILVMILLLLTPAVSAMSLSTSSPVGSLDLAASARRSAGFSVELIPWNSPDSPFHNPNATRADLSNLAILSADIRSEYRKRCAEASGLASVDIPIMPFGIRYGEYLIRYNIGTTRPSLETYGIFDTGSDLMWLQCSPCDDCYHQATRYFQPLLSPTYRNITCRNPECDHHRIPIARCFHDDQTCHYRVQYSDGTFSEGYLASEVFTFTQSDDDELERRRLTFGCGHINGDIRGYQGYGPPGVMGSSRNSFSLVGQMGYHQVSYCAPVNVNRPHGLMKMGSEAIITGPETQTRLYTSKSDYYHVKIVAIRVGGVQLQIPESVFHPNKEGTQGVIIDTRTAFSELVSEAFDPLIAEFKRRLLVFGETPIPKENRDLCYESLYNIPRLTIVFERGLYFEISFHNTWDVVGSPLYCLAIRRAKGNLNVLGIFQQRDVNVELDLKHNVASFMPMDCSSMT